MDISLYSFAISVKFMVFCKIVDNNVNDKNVIARNMSKWPEMINIVIGRHPKFFSNNKRKRKALFSVYEKLARHYRMKRKRKKAAFYAKIALKNGPSTTTLQEILIEEKMSKIRYVIRLAGKFL